MRPAFTLQLRLVPRPGEGEAACFAALAAAAERFAADARLTPADNGGPVFARDDVDARHALVTVAGLYPAAGPFRYSLAADLARTPLGLEAHVAVRAVPDGPAALGADPPPVRPRLVDDWLALASGLVLGEPVTTGVETVGRAGVPGLADRILDPARQLPLVVFAPLEDGRPLTDPAAVATRVAGLGRVVRLADKDATFALTGRVGKEWSCFHGAVRVYWPGVPDPPDDSFRRHPLFFPVSYPPGPDADARLPDDLFRRLAGRTHFRFSDPPLVGKARAAQAARDRAATEKRVADLVAGAEQGRELQAELERAWDESRAALLERDAARKALAEAQAELAFQREQWATVDGETAAARADAEHYKLAAARYQDLAFRAVRTVHHAVEVARAEFTDTLVFLPDAVKAAHDSPYRHPKRVFDLFAALDGVMRTLRASGGRAGEDLHAALKRAGFEYKPHISQTSTGKYGDEYTFAYGGRRQLFSSHVTLGSGHNPQECLSVHWLRDDAAGKFVVGHCGKHLTNTKS